MENFQSGRWFDEFGWEEGGIRPVAGANEQRIAALKEQIEKGRQLRYRYEARLEEMQKQRERLLAELKELQVTPEELEAEIARLQAEVDQLLQEAAELMPADLLKG